MRKTWERNRIQLTNWQSTLQHRRLEPCLPWHARDLLCDPILHKVRWYGLHSMHDFTSPGDCGKGMSKICYSVRCTGHCGMILTTSTICSCTPKSCWVSSLAACVFQAGLTRVPGSLAWVFVFLHLHLLMSPFLIDLLSKLPYSRSSWSSTPAVGKRYSCNKCCLRGDSVQRNGVSHKKKVSARAVDWAYSCVLYAYTISTAIFFLKKKLDVQRSARLHASLWWTPCVFPLMWSTTDSLSQARDATRKLVQRHRAADAHALQTQVVQLIFPTSRLAEIRSFSERPLPGQEAITWWATRVLRKFFRFEFGVQLHVSALIDLRTWCGTQSQRYLELLWCWWSSRKRSWWQEACYHLQSEFLMHGDDN